MRTCFTDDSLAFFSELALNNEKPWFEANRSRYERDVLVPMREFVAETSAACEGLDVPLKGDPAKSIYRINRDVRFSSDKSPYKTHCGALLTKEGIKHHEGVLYLHVDPTGSFLGVGFHMPEPDFLAAFRKSIVDEPADWEALLAKLPPLGTYSVLSRVPKGFEAYKESPLADSLKLKTYLVSRNLTDDELFSAALPNLAARFGKECLGLLEWGWRVRAKTHYSD